MTSTVIQELPDVIVETSGTVPEEENDTHMLLSCIAFNIAKIDKPLRISEQYRQYADGYSGYLEVVYRADHVLKWDRIQEFLRLLNQHTQAVQWYPLRSSRDSDLNCESQVLRIDVQPSINAPGAAGHPATGTGTEPPGLVIGGPGAEVVAAYRGSPRMRAYDQHSNHWAGETHMPYVRNEALPSAEDGGPALEPAPGALPLSYAEYLAIYQEEATKPLPAQGGDGYEDEYEVAVRTRSFHWHCCAWAHYKLGQLIESRRCFDKATAAPFNRFSILQQEARCPTPGIAPYPDQEYLLWQIGQQLAGGYPWGSGNLEKLYWVSMALTAVSPDKTPGLASLYSDYLGLMLQGQYYFVAHLKTQAFAALISDCETALRQAPLEYSELYRALLYEVQMGRACHMTDHPTATEREKVAVQELFDAFCDKRKVEDYRRLIQQYVGR